MIARLHQPDDKFILEAKAVYRQEDETVYLTTDEDLSDKGPDFIVHYSDDVEGVRDLRCVWAGSEKDGGSFCVALKVVEVIHNVQRRQDVKAKLNLPFRLALLQADDTFRTDPDTGKPLQYRAFLRDISAGGILIDTVHRLKVGQRFTFPFNKSPEPVLLSAEVIREQSGSGEFNRYGCRFYDSTNEKDAAVREYVFRLNLAKKPLPDDFEF